MKDVGEDEGGWTTACFALLVSAMGEGVEVVVVVGIRTSLTHYDRVNLAMLHWSSHRVGVGRENKT